MDIRKLTLLHSNDMHGDFLAEHVDKELVGGVSMLTWYVNEVKKTEENCIYVISGDMLQGSIIDTEFRGVSTIDIINMLQPDAVTLGNHELDYGLTHLLFLEKCAKFPIINANMYIKNIKKNLFRSHIILDVNGINILVIGVITEDILAIATVGDSLISTFMDVHEAADEVEKICNQYKNIDIDFTILLTHIGFEEDKKLAALLNPELGVDVIVGGHSHTFLEEPEKVNDILIVQAGVGTDFIGRFDIEVNMETNSVHDYRWQLVPITSAYCKRDKFLDDLLQDYDHRVSTKYNQILSRMKKTLTHPNRYEETEVGNLFADILADSLGVDLFILGSGSIRKDELHEIVTLGALKEIFPYDDKAMGFYLPGKVIWDMMDTFFRRYVGQIDHEYYQFNRGTKIVHDQKDGHIISIDLLGEPKIW